MTTNREKWIEILRHWKESGLTRTEFCKQNNLTLSTFDYWRRVTRSQNHGEPKLVKIKTANNVSSNPAIILKLAAGFKISVPADYRSEHLKRILTDIREVI